MLIIFLSWLSAGCFKYLFQEILCEVQEEKNNEKVDEVKRREKEQL
jgi:hypothetical protein